MENVYTRLLTACQDLIKYSSSFYFYLCILAYDVQICFGCCEMGWGWLVGKGMEERT